MKKFSKWFFSVAVSRSKDVPAFGPPIPENARFVRSKEFRDFLLTKIINSENSVHRSEKFVAMAARTRREYLKDLAENHATNHTLDSSSGKIASKNFFFLKFFLFLYFNKNFKMEFLYKFSILEKFLDKFWWTKKFFSISCLTFFDFQRLAMPS